MKKIIKFIAAFSIIFSLSNCQTEDLSGGQQDHYHAKDNNKISLSTFKLETGIKNVNPYTSVALSQDINGKVQPADFVLDTIFIRRHLSDIGAFTYSFRIYPSFDELDKSKKYNLVYRNIDNVWHTSIVSFKVEPNTTNQKNPQITDFENLYDSRAASGWCTELVWSIDCTATSYCKDGCDGFGCPTGECITVTSNTFPCGGGGGPSTGGGGTNPGGGGTNPGGGGTNPGGGGTNPGAGVTNPNGGGSAPVNPYQFTPNMWENPVFDDPNYLKAVRAQLLYEYVSLINATQWASENHATYMEILNWLLDDYTSKNVEFAKWAIDYFISNPNVTLDEFKNWYMGSSEGNDGGVSLNMDDYSNVIVQTFANLPNRNSFYDAFPKDGTSAMSSSEVYQLVGGHMWSAHNGGNPNYQNACAIRISRGLNYAGQPLPIFKNKFGQQKSEKGDDNKNYILDATSLLAYMLKAYSNNPPLHLQNKSPAQYLNALKGKWGIYIMIPKPNANFGASGHADFFSYSGCLSACYFTDAKEIYFWELN